MLILCLKSLLLLCCFLGARAPGRLAGGCLVAVVGCALSFWFGWVVVGSLFVGLDWFAVCFFTSAPGSLARGFLGAVVGSALVFLLFGSVLWESLLIVAHVQFCFTVSLAHWAPPQLKGHVQVISIFARIDISTGRVIVTDRRSQEKKCLLCDFMTQWSYHFFVSPSHLHNGLRPN